MSRHHTGNFVKALCIVAAAALAACTPAREEAGGTAAQVTIRFTQDDFLQTRSSFSWGEDDIRDIQVVVTTGDGTVHDVLYSDTPSDLQFTGNVGDLYKLWAAANIGGRIGVERLEDFTEAVMHVSASGVAASGVPMFSEGCSEIVVTGSGDHAVIPLKRMLARVEFGIDRSRLRSQGGFKVTGVSIYNPVEAYTPFAGNVSREHSGGAGYVFDRASAADLSRLNSGSRVVLYAFENMQGTLLPGNTDPWQKVPSKIGGAGPYCTYLEVSCSYETDTESCDDITYRMYLGKDATTNFDVQRNCRYIITLTPTDSEIHGGRGSWKIESGEWDQTGPVYTTETEKEIVLDPVSATLGEGESVYFTATYIERDYTLADGVRMSDEPSDVRTRNVTRSATWVVQYGRTYVVSEGRGGFSWSAGPGSAVIRAVYNSTYGAASITTLEPDPVIPPDPVITYVYRLEIIGIGSLDVGESKTLQARRYTDTYTDGVLTETDTVGEVIANSLLQWGFGSSPDNLSTTCEYAAISGGGVITGVKGGSCTVTAVLLEDRTVFDSEQVEIVELPPAPVPALTASLTEQDTWGGNSYPVSLIYDDGLGNVRDVTSQARVASLDCGSAPAGMITWDGRNIVAKDWWGMSGSWVTSSPVYKLTLSYNGLSVTVSGTMHGYTGAEITPTKDVWHYSEIETAGRTAPPVDITLVGSERTGVNTYDSYVADDYDHPKYILDNGCIGLGSGIPLHVEFTDPSNGYRRSGDTSFDVVTNVVRLHAYINVFFTQGSGSTSGISNTSGLSGFHFGSAGIVSVQQGNPPYRLNVEQSIWYDDYLGNTHEVTSPDGQADPMDSITVSNGWSLEDSWDARIGQGESHLIEIDVNGFKASWLWGYVGS